MGWLLIASVNWTSASGRRTAPIYYKIYIITLQISWWSSRISQGKGSRSYSFVLRETSLTYKMNLRVVEHLNRHDVLFKWISCLLNCSKTLGWFIPSCFNKNKTKYPFVIHKYLQYLKAWKSDDLQTIKYTLYLVVFDGGVIIVSPHISPKMNEVCFYIML